MVLIFKSIITFALISSFSLFFMALFIVAGILTTKWQRDVVERVGEIKNLSGYAVAVFGGLVSGAVSLVALVIL